MFPWESAVTGDEVTPRWSLPNDPYAEDVRIWCRDREIHISADVAYAIWYYWQATGDDDWMRQYGAEIILDTAIFWMSRVEWNTKQERYEIREVIGADEYHELVSNNAFTNRMVQWHLEKAVCIYDWLKATDGEHLVTLSEKLNLTDDRRSRWKDIIQNIWIPFDRSTGLVEQFEGYFKLNDINLQDYEPRTKSMQSILGLEAVNKWQVLKQPDVLMLLYLMRQSQEFPYTSEVIHKNWDYYASRTDITYGSSLGPGVHAILAADVDRADEAYKHFLQSAMVDLEDLRGNAADGIHGASAGAVWQSVIFGFAGIQLLNEKPIAKPHLPPGWTRLKFKFYWKEQWHEFDLKRPEEQTFPEVRGMIFDLDGVLTDTAEFHYQAWQRLADEEGLPFNRQLNESLRGVSRRDSLAKIIGDRTYGESQFTEMMDRKNQYYVDLIETITPKDLLPGALDLLDELKRLGIKVGLGSASKNALSVLEKLGIADRMDAIADGNSVVNSKPAPDLFLHAADQLGVKPPQCVVVEDAASGVEAALAGGMWAVGLGPSDRVGNAHLVLPNLKGMTFAELKGGLARSVVN
jgi:beta-phosphoglucomutase